MAVPTAPTAPTADSLMHYIARLLLKLAEAADNRAGRCLFVDDHDRHILDNALRGLQDPEHGARFAAFQSLNMMERIRELREAVQPR